MAGLLGPHYESSGKAPATMRDLPAFEPVAWIIMADIKELSVWI
jgi:hypothetical protein